jgi:DNA-binding GntR family transcriptional regulator
MSKGDRVSICGIVRIWARTSSPIFRIRKVVNALLPWSDPQDPDLIERVRQTSLGKLVRDELLAMILRGEIAPGARINEPDVAARLRVSRVPVREALRELESSGLVAARKHAGVFVREPSDKDMAELYELRALLDGHAGLRAAALPAASRQALVRMLAVVMRAMRMQAKAHDVQGYYVSNLGFHWAIVEAAGNDQLGSTYRGVVQQLHLCRLRNLSDPASLQASQAEHEQVHDALAAGDGVAAQQLLHDHVGQAWQRLQRQAAAAASAKPAQPPTGR